jgi:hypothetical protein
MKIDKRSLPALSFSLLGNPYANHTDLCSCHWKRTKNKQVNTWEWKAKHKSDDIVSNLTLNIIENQPKKTLNMRQRSNILV